MALNGSEILWVVPVQSNGQPSANQLQTKTADIAALSATNGTSVITALNTVGAGTITAAGIIGKTTARGGAQVAAFTDTTDTAALIIAALPNATVGQAFQWTYQNNTAWPATLAGGTGVTLSGAVIVAANSWLRYLVTYSAAGAVTMAAVEAGPNSVLPAAQFTAVAGGTPLTLTGAQVGGATDVTINLTAALGGAGTATLPTATNLVAAIPNAAAGMTYNLRIINSSSGAFAWTVTTNTGWTLTGTMTIAQNTFRDFVVTITALTTATLQQVGTGTTS